MIYRNKSVLKGKEISVMESLTAKRIKISKKTKKLYGFVHVWSQDDKIMFYVKSINKVKDFYNWNFGDVRGQLLEQKTLLILKYFCWGLFY